MIESQLHALFTEIADAEPGLPQLDTRLAHRRGRTRLRWRRARLASIPVVAAATAVIVALAVGTASARPAHRAATGTTPAGPGAPHQFNPLVPYVSFGWLPPGQSLLSGGSNRTAMSLTAGSGSNARSEWGLTVYAAGQCHSTAPAGKLACSTVKLNGLSAKFSSRAPAVGGHRAFWAGQYLLWPYARGGWAWLTLPVTYAGARHDPAKLDALQRDAVQIADHVRYGATTPLVFPAQLIRLPGQWQVSSAYYLPDAGVLRVSQYALTTGVPDYGGNGSLEYHSNMPNLMIGPATSGHTPCGPKIPEIINGYRVIVAHRGLGVIPGQELCAADAGGWALMLEEFGPHLAISVTSLFRDHLRLLGTNPAGWTTQPIG